MWMVTNQAIEETLWCRLISFFSYLFLSFYLAARTISSGSCSPWLVPFHKSQTVEREREKNFSFQSHPVDCVNSVFKRSQEKKKKKKSSIKKTATPSLFRCERIPVAEKEEKE
jgi:hypothetical protein